MLGQTNSKGNLGLESEIGVLDWYLNDQALCTSCSNLAVFVIDTGLHQLSAVQNGREIAENKVYIGSGHQLYALVEESGHRRIRFRGDEPLNQAMASTAAIPKTTPSKEPPQVVQDLSPPKAEVPPTAIARAQVEPPVEKDAQSLRLQSVCALPHQYERLKAATEFANSRLLEMLEIRSYLDCLSHDYTKLEFLRSIAPTYQKIAGFSDLSSALEYEWTRAAFAECLNPAEYQGERGNTGQTESATPP